MTTVPHQVITPRVPRPFFKRALIRLQRAWYRVRWARLLASAGRGSLIQRPMLIAGASQMSLGDHTQIWPLVRLEALGHDGSITIEIGERVSVQPLVHIAAVLKVRVGNRVGIGQGSYISDHDHDLSDGSRSVFDTKDVIASPVTIGDGVWLGERVCVLKGVTIGEGAIVGAGSIVTKDIPARCIAIGAPARVVKRWNDETGEWESVR